MLELRPGADAVIVALPKLTPDNCGWLTGVTAPAAINTVVGVIVTFDVSLLCSVTKVPPAGADPVNEIGNGIDCPVPTLRFCGSVMPPRFATATFAVVSAKLGRELARIIVKPAEMLVTGTFTLVAPATKVTVDGTVATLGWSELRLTVSPAGAGPDSVNSMF